MSSYQMQIPTVSRAREILESDLTPDWNMFDVTTIEDLKDQIKEYFFEMWRADYPKQERTEDETALLKVLCDALADILNDTEYMADLLQAYQVNKISQR